MNGLPPANGLPPSRTSPGQIAPSLRKISYEPIGSLARASINNSTMSHTAITPPCSEDESPWSSAVGHATTAGKSGRVIEKLMQENDRMKKELELRTLYSQEIERNLETTRPQLDALREENANLTHAKSVDCGLIARRDRKIESLKEELAVERKRREVAEGLSAKYEAEKLEAIELLKRDTLQLQEEAKHATVHANILEQSHRQLSLEYRRRAERWRKDIDQVHVDRDTDRQKFARLEVVADQMRSELERTRKAYADYVEQTEMLKDATLQWQTGIDKVVQADGERSWADHERSKKLNHDMEAVTKEMKWVISLEKSRRDVDMPEDEQQPEVGEDADHAEVAKISGHSEEPAGTQPEVPFARKRSIGAASRRQSQTQASEGKRKSNVFGSRRLSKAVEGKKLPKVPHT